MRIFGIQVGRSDESSTVASTSRSSAAKKAMPRFDEWRDPEIRPTHGEWQDRLDRFAAKSARQLSQAGTPLFRCEHPRDGGRTFRDAFWLVAADVDYAERSWDLSSREYRGSIFGDALLLTRSGVLCAAEFAGALSPSTGEAHGSTMDISFKEIRRDFSVLDGSGGWGWRNVARWRANSRGIMKLHGVSMNSQAIQFDARYHGDFASERGYGTSATLSAFVKSHGRTRWPRHFEKYGSEIAG